MLQKRATQRNLQSSGHDVDDGKYIGNCSYDPSTQSLAIVKKRNKPERSRFSLLFKRMTSQEAVYKEKCLN